MWRPLLDSIFVIQAANARAWNIPAHFEHIHPTIQYMCVSAFGSTLLFMCVCVAPNRTCDRTHGRVVVQQHPLGCPSGAHRVMLGVGHRGDRSRATSGNRRERARARVPQTL